MIHYTHERNFGCRLMEYVYRGVRCVTLENQLLRITVLADKGSDIYEFLYKPLDVDFMWRSPWGVRNPAPYAPTSHHDASAFHDFYAGGWQDCLPTGMPCEYRGRPFGAHGETPTLAWDYRIMEDDPQQVSVQFTVRTYRTPFLVSKILTLRSGEPVLSIREQVVNEGRTTMELLWGQHPALGAPFLSDACVIDLPDAVVECRNLSANTRFVEGDYRWPHVPGRDGTPIDLRKVCPANADTADTIRLTNLEDGWFAVTNTECGVGFGMSWPREVYRSLWFWQVYGGAYGPPWYGRTYNIALEPFSSAEATLPGAIAAGTAHRLEPGAALDVEFVAVAYRGRGVAHISPAGEVTLR